MENEDILLEKLESHFSSIVSEKTKSRNKDKFDKLIKELERINTGNNEHVKQAIALLKRERDLGESVLLDYLFSKTINEDIINELLGLINGKKGDIDPKNDKEWKIAYKDYLDNGGYDIGLRAFKKGTSSQSDKEWKIAYKDYLDNGGYDIGLRAFKKNFNQ